VVKIRLKRIGATKRPVYRLVVADSRSPRDGRFIEAIGFYDPLPNPAVVRIDVDRVKLWMQRGARPSDTARSLLVQQGVLAATPRPVREAAPQVAGAGGAAGRRPEAISEEPRLGAPAATGPAPGEEPAEPPAATGPAPETEPAEPSEAIPEEPRGGAPAATGPAEGETSEEAGA
jgi:small subunit ribosomal protein S16